MPSETILARTMQKLELLDMYTEGLRPRLFSRNVFFFYFSSFLLVHINKHLTVFHMSDRQQRYFALAFFLFICIKN